MGTRIEGIATARGGRLLSPGALDLADAAARHCLERAQREPSDVELLVNAGIYREKNLGEPALAAMIQEDIGANPGHVRSGAHGTFSFDVANGGCGVITAAFLVDGFLRAGTVQLGLVVASDSDPGDAEGFEHPAAGGALLLSRAANAEEGFVAFQLDTYPEHVEASTSRVRWTEHEPGWVPHLHPGRNVLYVDQTPDFAERATRCASESVRKLLERHALTMGDVDVVIPSQAPAEFPAVLARALGVRADRVVVIAEEHAHTAGPLIALEEAMADGRFVAARWVLFVTVGAGISVGVGLYRRV